jgi:hypothetical protein
VADALDVFEVQLRGVAHVHVGLRCAVDHELKAVGNESVGFDDRPVAADSEGY